MTMLQSVTSPIHMAVDDDGIAVLTLNRPEARNAISDEMRSHMIELLEEVAANSQIRALIITGTGKGFCAGGDIKGMEKRMSAPAGEVAFNGWKRQQRVHHAVSLLLNLPKPTLAAVNGAATGLGCDLALSCDFVVSSRQASYAMSYIARGLIPDGGGLYLLPRRVGLPKAKELIYTGRSVQPEEGLAIGLVDRVVDHDDLLDETRRWALELSAGSATALALSKSILNNSFELTQAQVLAMGSQAQGICYTSAEHQASVAAFLAAKAKRG
ncbi:MULTISPECIES: enoyl-CoA hydratase/isomerase family protein [Pseudomonas]|uniref:Enoyl-CoA hydratase/isomerase family protein n=1 Tax=Pseudomonas mandelii TaxID=75612 RepID=A0AB36CYU1_9PSED|nr:MULTISPECIES: enoyl-CoA hydratase/isomerase family protein [Pseudomonas]NMZ81204.1 enoyl-CoA hydratase/isomerase family protein [Pseudomonas mandelii]PMV84840.1 enoyl-CoA hydratase [Pseudomonas sp. GW101-1A09]PMV94941.1 enoyl-CoA hydratase [Pseudomonas sp. FW306-2-2C-B10A]PMV95182.1 enoyl-CoA hydratase [Pseudomonas sp. GW460-C8]PMW03844.1 enoyl-CoA hydratase [Pseudomonas sp. MPR-TSA4]